MEQPFRMDSYNIFYSFAVYFDYLHSRIRFFRRNPVFIAFNPPVFFIFAVYLRFLQDIGEYFPDTQPSCGRYYKNYCIFFVYSLWFGDYLS